MRGITSEISPNLALIFVLYIILPFMHILRDLAKKELFIDRMTVKLATRP